MRAVIYLRVSTKEQAEKGLGEEGFSIPAQREACARHVEDQGWTVVDEYVDRVESARSAHRPQLQAMLARIIEDCDVDIVVVHKVDRLARNMEDHVAIQASLRKCGVRLVSITENLEESASGRFVEGIHALMAEFYSANLASEVKKGMGQKAKQGGWPSKAPLGYVNVRDFVEGRQIARIVPDSERAPHIREAFRLYSTGDWTLERLTKEMADRGLKGRGRADRAIKPIGISAMSDILNAKVYAGIVEWEGVEYQGQHEPLVDRETFDAVGRILAGRTVRNVRERKHNHHLKGSVWCGVCGRRMSCQQAKGTYLYFYCLGQLGSRRTGCREPYISADVLESEIEALYRRVKMPDSVLAGLRVEIEAQIATKKRGADSENAAMTAKISACEAERQKLMQAYYANAIDITMLKAEQDRIAAEVSSAQNRLDAVGDQLDEWGEILELAMKLASSCDRAYKKASNHERRLLNQAFFEKIEVRGGKIAEVTFADPFGSILYVPGSNKRHNVGDTGFEPVTFTVSWCCATELRQSPSYSSVGLARFAVTERRST